MALAALLTSQRSNLSSNTFKTASSSHNLHFTNGENAAKLEEKCAVVKREAPDHDSDTMETFQEPYNTHNSSNSTFYSSTCGGGESSSDQEWKPMRSRSFLTDAQVGLLEQQFKRNRFPSKYDLSALAEKIGVNKRVVQVCVGKRFLKHF